MPPQNINNPSQDQDFDQDVIDIDSELIKKNAIPKKRVRQQPQLGPNAAPLMYQPKNVTKDFTNQINFMGKIMSNMVSSEQKRIMIGGDTGLGKTSFVRQFCRMLGIPSIVIEIPHIVEEELINIPFVTFNQTGQPVSQGSEYVDTKKGTTVQPQPGSTPSDVRIVLAKSHLVHKLETLHKIPDNQYPNWIRTELSADEQELIRQFEDEFPGLIAETRAELDNVLFFDEYYRTATPAIRNILRGVLNRAIGNDPLPRGTYVMYASNISDVSGTIDKMSAHTTSAFDTEIFQPPTKEQWLNYTVSKAIEKGVQFKADVISVFNDALADEHISYNDVESEIRTSPRRWSEILLYINNSFPFKSPDEVGIITTVLKKQFENTEGAVSKLYQVLQEMLEDLAELSNIPPSAVRSISPKRWREVIAHQVLSQQEIGASKKYVPVIQGPPGIGKTSMGEVFEQPPYNMRFIVVNAPTLSKESVTGIPLPAKDKSGMGVNFAEPELSIYIKNQIANEESNYYQRLKEKEQRGELGGTTAKEMFSAFKKQKYKYLIFFDEINRVKSADVFNSIRRLVLEKEFNHQYALPEGSVVVGAMNPVDLGTQPLSSHFRDAIDLIDSEPDWGMTLDFIKNKVVPHLKNSYNPSNDSINIAYDIISEFPREFSDRKSGRESHEFYINLGGTGINKGGFQVYFNPRDYDSLFRGLVKQLDLAIKSFQNKIKRGDNISPDVVNARLVDVAYEKIYSAFRTIFINEEISADGFMNSVRAFLADRIDLNLSMKTSNVGLSSILMDLITGQDLDTFELDNYLSKNASTPSVMKRDLLEFFDNVEKSTGDDTQLLANSLLSVIKVILETLPDLSSDTGAFNDQIDEASLEFFNELMTREGVDSMMILEIYDQITNLIIKAD